MAEEKILKEEILDDAELEGVAGGTKSEVNDDVARLKQMGFYESSPRSQKVDNVKAAFAKLGSDIGVDLGVSTHGYYNNQTANKYYINGIEVSRKTMWDYIEDVYSRNKK